MLKIIFKHLKTICKHKAIVCLECMKCGFIWRGLMHDNSKFGLAEFLPSAKYFEGNKNTEKVRNGYYLAWLHHKGHNPHHWEYWIEFDREGKVIANKIPYEYVVEMVCDWIGAGMVYSKDKWTQGQPLMYYKIVRRGQHFHPETEALIIKFLECIRDKGLKEFHKMARTAQKSYLNAVCNTSCDKGR